MSSDAQGFEYEGAELDLFAHARNWKAYWISRIQAHVGGDVLEVGAGLGANTAALQSPGVRSWTCLEPDPQLAARIQQEIREIPGCSVKTGTIESLPDLLFDSILYIDVLEHVEDDLRETALAAARLRQGGRLIVLSPAHQFLYSPFDRAIGHYRRYDRASLRACQPEACAEARLEYLDAAGMLLSLANRALLRQSMPTLQQIHTWDRLVVPLSRIVDPILGRRVGKSILVVWTRR